MDPLELILVGLGVAVGATLQSATGFGFALVAGPAVFAAAKPAEAISILLVLGAVLNLLIMLAERRPSEVQRAEAAHILGWAAPGIVAGILILLALAKPTLQVAVGICVIVAAAIQARGIRRPPREGHPVVRAGAGFAAGALTTTTTTSGPPLVLYLQSTGTRPEPFRDTMAALLLALNVMGAIGLVLADGRAELPDLGTLAVLIAIVAIARPAGRTLFERCDPPSFRVAGLALIVASGAASIAGGALALA